MANKPALLAHHFTEAGLNDRAVPYWTPAGQHALERVAFAEAVSQLETALTVNDRLLYHLHYALNRKPEKLRGVLSGATA